jgi:choline kinase
VAPHTDATPKCLLPIAGSSLLERMLDTLASESIEEVLLVVGHAREKIEAFLERRSWPYRVGTIFNPEYDTANNIYSAWLARDRCADGFLLLNSDVAFHPQVLADVVRAAGSESLLAVDPARPPRDEAMKVRFEDGRLAEIGKEIDPSRADGEYIGIARFGSAGAPAFFSEVEAILGNGGSGEWYESAIGAAARKVPFRACLTGSLPWIEIDAPEDLQRAEQEVFPILNGSRVG